MHFRSAICAVAFALAVQARCVATTINFDDLLSGNVVTNQYPEVVFSSNDGNENRTLGDAGAFGSSAPNHILTGAAGGGLTGLDETILTFTAPVNNLTFVATAVNVTGDFGSIDIAHDGGTLTTISVVGDGTPNLADPVDVSAYQNVSQIRIHSLKDPGGVGWDDFSFTVVPEPSSLCLGTLAFGAMLIVAIRRR